MFGSIFGSRSFDYEIYVMIDGRWRLDKRLEGEPGAGRIAAEQLEKNAIAQANALLNVGDFSAVKVIRTRENSNSQTEIFSKQATARPKVMQTRPFRGVFPVCETVQDLGSRAASRGFGAVYREFLDKQNCTAVELVHSPQQLRKLSDQNNFMRAGLYALAGAQTQPGLPGQAERSKKLEALFDKLINQTRAAMAEKTLPGMEGSNFDAMVERLKARYTQPGDARFYIFFQLAKHLMQMNSYAAKLDFALKLMAQRQHAENDALLDELAASCLDSSQLIQDVLGHRPGLAEALTALAELSSGTLQIPATPQTDPLLQSLNAMLGQQRLPLVVDTLWERIHVNLVSKAMLARNDAKKEWQLTRNLNHKLLSLAPPSYKEAIDHAGRMRMERVRDMQS